MNDALKFLQSHCPDGGFLQSDSWRAFQEAAGHETVHADGAGYSMTGIVHELPIVGKYLYIPRGPVIEENRTNLSVVARELERIARESVAKWIRVEPKSEKTLEQLQTFLGKKVVKAPHDVQPREIFAVDIAKPEDGLLAGMKPKTRYNIRLAEKKGVKVFATREEKYRQAFLDLIMTTADRKEIVPHPRGYYEKFFSVFPEDMCHFFVAEYEGEVLAANLLVTFGEWAYYLHGGSSDRHRDVMAPYLLQWEQMKFARARGCVKYDFGGVRVATKGQGNGSWEGITRFKRGFSSATEPLLFPGAYDIVLDAKAYFLYDHLRLLKENLLYMKKFFGR